jgi:hypothetical protein
VSNARTARIIPALAAVVFGVVALACAPDYGPTFDSQVWFPFGDRQLDYALGGGDRPGTGYTPAFRALGPLAAMMASATNELLHERLGLVDPIVGRHVFIVLCGAALVGLTARLALDLFGPAPAIWAAALLASHPRFFAEAQNNISDTPAAAASVAAVVWVVRAVNQNRLRPLCAAVLAAAALASIKFPNVIFLSWVLLAWLAVSGDARTRSLRLLRRLGWTRVAGLCGALLACVWLFRPLAWSEPVGELWAMIEHFVLPARAGYTRGTVPVFYRGEVSAAMSPAYHAVMLLVTTPVPVLLALLVGVVLSWQRCRAGALLLFAWAAIVLGRHGLLGVGNYAGVRHVIDGFPAFAILAGVGADAAVGGLAHRAGVRWNRAAAGMVWSAGFAVVVGSGVLGIARLHPYPVAYYNALVGGLRGGSRSFETEYSGSVYREGLRWAAANLSEGDVLWVHRAHVDYMLTRMQALYLGIDEPAVIGGRPADVATRLGELEGQLFMMQILRPGPRERYPRGFELKNLPVVHEVRRDGVALLRIRRVPPDVVAEWRSAWSSTGPHQ